MRKIHPQEYRYTTYPRKRYIYLGDKIWDSWWSDRDSFMGIFESNCNKAIIGKHSVSRFQRTYNNSKITYKMHTHRKISKKNR